MVNCLVFPSGTEIGFEINNALKYAKNIKVIGGTSVSDHSELVYETLINEFPFIDNDFFITYLNKKIKEFEIDFIYPAHDSVQLFLTQNMDKIDAQIITASLKTVEICRSKYKTYAYLKGESFIPSYYKDPSLITNYPVFVKPEIGQGSQGAKVIYNLMDLTYYVNQSHDNYIICEFLSGAEFTIDCFTDINGALKVVKMRTRERIRMGISVRSQNVSLTLEVKEIAEKINSKFSFNGAWFFQIKKNSNNIFKLLEISARVPGTMGVSRNLGINFPLLTIYNFLGISTEISENKMNIMLDRAFISRYVISLEYDTVYIDFDDTIIQNNKVNLIVIYFLFQMVNENKKIILLTRHTKDIYKSLENFKISSSLFYKIINVGENVRKSHYIEDKNAIFIDDSFKERIDVKNNVGISVYDLDMIESLIDWRN